ncbi:MAG: hypothetical protein IJT62_09335 [Oscillospiraceae bacterium]|nr:hypothetical protein [Oscillospiraceae bacterium]
MIPTNYFESWEEYKDNNQAYEGEDEIIGPVWDDLNKEMFLFILLNTF